MIFGKKFLLNVRPVASLLAISILPVSFLALIGSPAIAQPAAAATIVTIGQATLDSARNAGPRYVRLDFDSLAATEHTITVTWDSNADIRFKVKKQDGTNLSPTIRETNPGSWTGVLEANTSYFIGLWSSDGIASYTATIEANVDITPSISILSEPSDLTVNMGANAEFTVEATGSDAISYQWLFNDVEIAGATNTNLLLTDVATDAAGTYAVVVTDDNNGDFTLVSAELTVAEPTPLMIISHPADLTVTEGDSATFTVEASGNGLLSYQWFANNEAIPSATQSTLTLTSVGINDSGNTYTVNISDVTGTIISSDYALLSVDENTLQPTIVDLGQGIVDSQRNAGPRYERLDFDSLAATEHTITVTWDSDADVRFKVKEMDGTDVSPTIQGPTPGTWTGALEANTAYFIGLWSTDGIANYTATLEANLELAITQQPTDATVLIGDDAEFSVDATGRGSLAYQWFVDGLPITGENANSMTVFATSVVDNGRQYSVEVSNSTGTISSNTATLTVAVPPAPRLYSNNADNNAWMLHGPAPTLDFNASEPLSSWGRVLLRIDDVLLVGGDFEGIKPTLNGSVTDRPWLAALNAITGQPISTFQIPLEVDSVVRALVLSPNGDNVYVGGDFGLLALDAQTGALDFSVDIRVGSDPGRVLDIAVNENYIYVGGQFSRIENVSLNHVARLSHEGTPDRLWKPKVRGGFNNGREALVQAVTLSPSGDAVYLGGNFLSINDVDVPTTNRNTTVSMLVVDTSEGASVRPERFTPIVEKTSRVKVRDIAVTEDHVIVAWGGPNHLGFHSHDGALLYQYDGTGDTQGLKVVGDLVYVAHHGEFFGSLTNPIPVEAVQSLDPEIVVAHKFHSFRLDAPGFPLEQAWRIEGFFGVWGIAVAEDSIWVSGQISLAGSNNRFVNGLARFPATGPDEQAAP